jgi:hypothetical protein
LASALGNEARSSWGRKPQNSKSKIQRKFKHQLSIFTTDAISIVNHGLVRQPLPSPEPSGIGILEFEGWIFPGFWSLDFEV